MITVKPIFRIFDLAKAKEFYVGWLGFKVDWWHRWDDHSPIYLQISKNGFMLHLSEHYNDCSPGARIHVENWPDLAAWHKMLIKANYPYNRPGIGPAAWNKEITVIDVIDPFRNMITFSEPKLFVPD